MEPGWGIIVTIAVFILLAIGISGSVFIYNRRISESEKRFYRLFDNVFDALIHFNPDWQIISVNESACKLLGYSKKEFSRLKIGALIPKREWKQLRTEFEKTLKSGLDFVGETHLKCKKNDVVRVDIAATKIIMSGAEYILASVRDIGQRRIVEETLREKNIALKELLTHIEEEKLNIKKEVAKTIDQVLIPTVDKIVEEDGTVNKAYFDSLKKTLKELSASTGGAPHFYSKLTPREVQICNLIKSGVTSKEIAEALHLSIETVLKHRNTIRKKLNISNTEVTLANFLTESD